VARSLRGTSPVVAQRADSDDLSRWVDPLLGTSGTGGTFPGATVPWGLVSASPHTATDVSGGYRRGQPVLGFGQVHFSGSPPVLGMVLLRPTANALSTSPSPSPIDRESAAPGYYGARLLADSVDVEASATARTTLYRFRFHGRGPKTLLLDASHALGLRPREHPRAAVTHVTSTRIEGWAEGGSLGGLGDRPRVYFVAEVSRPGSVGSWRPKRLRLPFRAPDPPTGAWWRFATADSLTVLVRIGISYVDADGARRNLAAEQPTWDFERVRTSAALAWRSALARIRVGGGTDADRRAFYTALYHALLHPSLFEDVDGRYRRYLVGDVGRLAAGEHRYTGFSLWDTFRTVHPLLVAFYPERARGMVESLLGMQREAGWLPQWELAARDANAMVGDPAAVVIAEGYLAGIVRQDESRALDALVHNATRQPPWRPGHGGNKGRLGLSDYVRLGYVAEPPPPSWLDAVLAFCRAMWQRITDTFSGADYENARVYGSVATTQEYAYADACIARLALHAGRTREAAEFDRRARGYRLLFDSVAPWSVGAGPTGVFRPRLADGAWAYPLQLDDPRRRPRRQAPGFVEGDEWSYMFGAPHDVTGMVSMAGGEDAFARRLDAYFGSSALDMENEPSIGYPYLPALVGRPALTQSVVRTVVRNAFAANAGGLPGEDDGGTLSAWMVWSALGLYPYDPCGDELVLGAPLFSSVAVADAGGAPRFRIDVDRAGVGRPYVAGATLGDNALARPIVHLAGLSRGTTLTFRTSDRPTVWAAKGRLDPVVTATMLEGLVTDTRDTPRASPRLP
jgi:predicted alpha-1,2-mannosidase